MSDTDDEDTPAVNSELLIADLTEVICLVSYPGMFLHSKIYSVQYF